MAIVVIAEIVTQRSEYRGGPGPGIPFRLAGTRAHLPDEVVDADGMRLCPAARLRRHLRRQRLGQIGRQVPGLAGTDLARESIQHRPGDIRRFLTRQASSVSYGA